MHAHTHTHRTLAVVVLTLNYAPIYVSHYTHTHTQRYNIRKTHQRSRRRHACYLSYEQKGCCQHYSLPVWYAMKSSPTNLLVFK